MEASQPAYRAGQVGEIRAGPVGEIVFFILCSYGEILARLQRQKCDTCLSKMRHVPIV